MNWQNSHSDICIKYVFMCVCVYIKKSWQNRHSNPNQSTAPMRCSTTCVCVCWCVCVCVSAINGTDAVHDERTCMYMYVYVCIYAYTYIYMSVMNSKKMRCPTDEEERWCTEAGREERWKGGREGREEGGMRMYTWQVSWYLIHPATVFIKDAKYRRVCVCVCVYVCVNVPPCPSKTPNTDTVGSPNSRIDTNESWFVFFPPSGSYPAFDSEAYLNNVFEPCVCISSVGLVVYYLQQLSRWA